MPSTLPSSIPDSQLGLSQSELHILRQHQQIALSSGSSSAAPHYAHSTTSSRGRGHARSSASTSRAASAASSGPGGSGRLLLDAGSLAVLGSHFERLMGAIQSRVNHLTAQTQRSTIHQSSRAQSSIAAADAEIARFRDILRQIDDLETEFDKVRHIRDIVKGFRSRVEGLERRVVVVDGRGTAMRGRR
ncbi:hypothetical protein IMSHALPRED_010018 [Imshaugia aleurites]|uniref:Biogenesis of lysosome-related organelles complex 1 subunit CNL1 n=1 Tax=Imshaugia aleurites TaxID=172621 RepID=A0A8H3EW40_9LECA|nr:hypothetical protein IMSHALPRED_010018 [Imshaugia aleurites]